MNGWTAAARAPEAKARVRARRSASVAVARMARAVVGAFVMDVPADSLN